MTPAATREIDGASVVFSVVKCRNDILCRLTGLAERISCWTIPFQGLKEKQEERKTTLLCSTASTLIHTKTKISRTGGSLKVCRGLPQINNKLIFIVLSSQYPLPRPTQSQPSTPSTFHTGSSGCVQVPDTMALGQGISIYKLVCSQTGL